MLKKQKGDVCLNCGHPVKDLNFCPECGQANDTRRLTFIALIGESLSNFFAIDGRIFNTISGVLLKPGKVASDFKAGKRMRYMNPVRFYFLSSVLLISSIQFGSNQDIVKTSLSKEELEVIEKLSPEQREKSLLETRIKYKAKSDPGFSDRFNAFTRYLNASPESTEAEVFEALEVEAGFWNEFAFAQAQKASNFAQNQQDNFKDFNRKLISQLFWILFLFIPLLGVILNVIYFRSDIYYPEHLFFTLYQQGLFFISSFLVNLVSDNEIVFMVLTMAFAVHLLLAMKNFYGQKWGKTITKFLLVNLFGIAAFIVFFLLALVIVFILL